MDGTLGKQIAGFGFKHLTTVIFAVDSTAAVNSAFDLWSQKLQMDPIKVKAQSHGVRLQDSVKKWYNEKGTTLTQVRQKKKYGAPPHVCHLTRTPLTTGGSRSKG